MKTIITFLLVVFSNLTFAQVARIDKANSNDGVAFFSETYKVEFCQRLARNGACVDLIEATTLKPDQKFVLVQEAILRYFDLQGFSYKGYMDALPLYFYLSWSEEKREIYESLMRYDFKNQRRFLIGGSSYQACAGCDDDTSHYEIVYNISKDLLHINSEFYQARD